MTQNLKTYTESEFDHVVKTNYEKLINPNSVEIPTGWYNLILDMMAEIAQWQQANSNVSIVITQIKEKFATLRVYYKPVVPIIEQIIQKYSELSVITCNKCGKTGKVDYDCAWWNVKCDECREIMGTNFE